MRPQKRARSISRRGGAADGHALEGKDELEESPAGVIFMCSSLTRKDCFRFKVLGMRSPHKDLVHRIAPGTILFLFDTDLKELYGIFEAVSYGGTDLEPQAFQDSKGLYPAQVRFDIYRECLPLTEDVLRHAISENYFSHFKFQFELTDEQVARLVKLFHPIEPPRRRLDGSRFPRRLSREQERVRGPPDYFYQEDEERQVHFRQRVLHPSVEMHPGYGHKGLGRSIPYEEFYRPEEHGHPNEDFYPVSGRGPPITSEDFYPIEERGHHIPDEGFYLPKARVSPTPRDVFYPSEERRPPIDRGEFYTSEGHAPPIYNEEYYPSKVRVPPIYHKDFYPLEEQGPLDSRGFVPHKQQDHLINREHLYPHEDRHPHVPYEGLNPPLPYEVHQVPSRDDRQPLNVMEDRYHHLEHHYLPITEPVHHEDRPLPVVRNPAQHGGRFSLSHVRGHRNELDFPGPLPAYNNSAVEMINEHKQGDMLHLNQPHPPKRDAFNPADILEPKRMMEEVDLLAMKYVKNDPNFIGNTRSLPFSSTQPDAFDKKQMAGGHDPPTMSKAIGGPPLRRSHWNKERNLSPALGQETGAFRKFRNNLASSASWKPYLSERF